MLYPYFLINLNASINWFLIRTGFFGGRPSALDESVLATRTQGPDWGRIWESASLKAANVFAVKTCLKPAPLAIASISASPAVWVGCPPVI
jgi:hypothetical protein